MGFGSAAMFANPEMQKLLDTLKQAGIEMAKSAAASAAYEQRIAEEGFPTQRGGMASAPFDVLGDVLRGTKGLMLDMYRRPQTVLKAVDMLLPLEVDRAIATAKRGNGRYVHIPLHKGLDGFMSPDQFKKFFWPTLRELVIAIADAGLIPYLFWEGDCTSRLDLIKDVPPGKCLYRFEATDIFKAKDALRDRVCIRGNVPISLLSTATPEDVRAYCKKVIDYVGKGGGLLLDAAASVTDARPENLHAMLDSVRE
jgi:uroporphyrinogen-III decarboxylase